MTYFAIGAVIPLALLVWSGRLVAAHSEVARRRIVEASGIPAMPPPSAGAVLASGLVGLGALGAIVLLTMRVGLSPFVAAGLVVPFAAALSYVVRCA
jgi:hypothetical protein